MTPEVAGYEIRASRSKISRMENGRVRFKVRDVEDLLALLRRKRQDLLTRPVPPRIWAILDEAVLRRPVGGAEVMRAQLRHVIEASLPRRAIIQVVPFDRGGHADAGGSFAVLRFEEQFLPDIVYVE